MQSSQPDPFGTAELRRRVLDAWTASPARFREDANAEEDYALGGYRDRVVVELAQNAADAAAREGVPGRLRLTLRAGTLVAANTGAPLDAAGVAALSTLRASSKRGPDAHETAVGRFGVGFAAAVAVSDEPRISSLTGAVAWSRSAAHDLVSRIPAVAAELAGRSGHLPVLRLPFAADGAPPEGFATAVTLPLRDEAADRLIQRLLAETGPALLLALPAAGQHRDRGRRHELARSPRRTTATASRSPSTAQPAGGARRPRAARLIRGCWPTALPRSAPAGLGRCAGRCRSRWVARTAMSCLAACPGGSAVSCTRLRRRTNRLAFLRCCSPRSRSVPTAATSRLARSLTSSSIGPPRSTPACCPGLAPGPRLLDLVPSPVARGELDAQLGRAILARLPEAAFLPAAEGPGPRVRPHDAVILDAALPDLAASLARVLPGLIAGPARHPAYAVLGVRRLGLADLADMLASLDRDPAWWRQLYEALAAAEAGELGELGALPVPLADGRLVRGPRGLLLPGPGLEDAGLLALLGLRVVHPGAVHRLLARLGAVEATPRGVLADPIVRAAVTESYDEDDPGPVADTVLGLVAAAHLRPGEQPWLADLALPGTDGEWHPAGEMLLPGSPLAEVVAADTPFGTAGPDLLTRYGAATLEAVGVLSSFGQLVAEDVALDAPDLDLDGAEEWAADTCAQLPGSSVPPVAAEVRAVRDLELVDPARWPQALDLLAAPPLRAALVEPTRVLLADGRHADVPSYTAWWLRHHPVLGGHRPADVRAADADPLLAGLYDETDLPADPAVARALGVRTSVAELLAEPGGADELLDRLADPGRPVTRAQLRALWAALAAVADAAPPNRVRTVRGDEVVVAGAMDALVLDTPDLWPLVATQPLVLAPYDRVLRLADLLDLPLVSEKVAGLVESAPERRPVPAILRAALPEAPATYNAHDRLVVDGVPVPWRYTHGAVHASGPEGLVCGLAWAAGKWSARHLLADLLRDPSAAARLLAEADLDADLPSEH